MEWTVVGVIVVLVGLFFTVGKPILQMCTRMEKLDLETHQEAIDMTETKHTLKELVQISQTHEMRIHDLEQDVDAIKKGK